MIGAAPSREARAMSNEQPEGADSVELMAAPDAAAKIVYEAMTWAADQSCTNHHPAWVERGNSIAQDKARDAARAVTRLSAEKSAHAEGVVAIWSGEHDAYWYRGSNDGGAGYTRDTARAGVWSRAEAERLTSHCGPEKLIALHDRPAATSEENSRG